MRRLIPLLAAAALLAPPPLAAAEIRDIAFPVAGATTYVDDFGDPRAGHTHEGVDIHGKKMQPLLAAVDGRVVEVVWPEESWGYAVVIRDGDGYTYHYLHVNNDTPNTDDGNGGYDFAYAPGIVRGARVTRGQVIAYMGDSGNAEDVGPHLHFEIRLGGQPIDPYPSLVAAEAGGSAAYSVEAATAAAPDINADKNLVAATSPKCVSGSLIKSKELPAVYYCGADGRRHIFPNALVYATWYPDFKAVQTLTKEELAAIPLGTLITYRPGSRLVKIRTESKVYAVAPAGTLRHVISPAIAAALYGAGWADTVEDIPDEFFVSYRIGDPITVVGS